LTQENRKLESDFNNALHELDKARKEPDYVREQFSSKLQRVHDRIRKLESDVEEIPRTKIFSG
jgi:prefoldin subunit 5